LLEHQYLFAVNTISCVKSDAFFFYQPPLNLLEWTLHPLCYILPRRRFIKLNRYIIKATHLPFLVLIYSFERFYLRPKNSGYIPLQRTSSFETLANGFGGAKVETIHGRRGFRRESIATQAAQHVLDEVFRSSVRGPRNAYYGAVRGNNTAKPRMTDWIKEIPTPRIVAKSPMTQSIPSISVSEIKPLKRRRISLTSTVIESEGETDELTTTCTAREGSRLGEEHDGDDEYDEANAVMEDEDVTDQDTGTELLRVYPVQSRSPRKGRPSPSRRWSSKPGKFGQRGRKARSRSPSSEKEKEKDSQVRRLGQRRSEDGFPLEKDVLVEKLRSLERLVEDIRHVLTVQSPTSTSTTL
jgi:hypothetical protein